MPDWPALDDAQCLEHSERLPHRWPARSEGLRLLALARARFPRDTIAKLESLALLA